MLSEFIIKSKIFRKFIIGKIIRDENKDFFSQNHITIPLNKKQEILKFNIFSYTIFKLRVFYIKELYYANLKKVSENIFASPLISIDKDNYYNRYTSSLNENNYNSIQKYKIISKEIWSKVKNYQDLIELLSIVDFYTLCYMLDKNDKLAEHVYIKEEVKE